MFETIESNKLVKVFGRRPVIRRVGFSLKAGEIVGLIGANGSGKSTLLFMLSSLLPMTSGTIEYGGHAYADHPEPEQLRGQIGWLAHSPFLYPELSATENLKFFTDLYLLDSGEERYNELLKQVGLWEARHQKVRHYSRGMVQRLGLARVLLKNPKLWLLDEPFTGLDKQTVEQFSVLLEDIAGREGNIMILVSHRMELIARLCKRILILSRGKLAYDGPVEGEAELHTLADENF